MPALSEHRKFKILIAEDNPGDVLLIREALQAQHLDFELILQKDGEQMLAYVTRIGNGNPCPDLILLDLNLPRTTGETLLRSLRQNPACQKVPVIIVTSSDSPVDRQVAFQLGANGYFCKPSDYDEFMRLGTVVREHVMA